MLSIPELPVPYAERINPATELAEDHVRGYLREFGLLRSADAMFHYDRTRFGELVGRAYPDADPDGLLLITDWMAVWAMFDDYLEKIPDEYGAEEFDSLIDEAIGWLSPPSADAVAESSSNPLAHAFRDIWRRMCARMSPTWQARFVRHVLDYLGGCRWESVNRRHRRFPDLASYVTTRRRFGGMKPSMDLTELGGSFELPEHVHAHQYVQELLAGTADLVLWVNDIFSVEAEAADGNINNIVLVVQHERGCSLQSAVDIVAGMVARRVREFTALTANPADGLRELDVPAATLADVDEYIRGMTTWIRGNIDWSRGNERYRSAHYRVSDQQPNYLRESLVD
jgi:hypothetical protein